ncbi:hypothetical protein Zmor_025920 [Zophobas morio]|uniref:Peptidase S1 domain-containing protein n=1 Tax=Zophobas morio TaxID=2755281 RepID=A0AA38HSP9_9CUCU|nr:hypothetical protein Zmor_025920 [Zophobas morio]
MYYFALILCLSVALVHSKPNIGSRIVGGQLARSGQFPWQVAVYVDTADGKFFCGGSLISDQWILSAAHCLYNARLYTVHLGSTTLQSADSNRVVLATSTHEIFPNFDPMSLEHDIGLIKLHMPISFNDYIQPIQLARLGQTTEGALAIASGWGQISDAQTGIVNSLNYVNVAIISNAECQITYGNQIKSTMICTVGNYNEGICLGDTGGPLVITRDGEYIQVGVSGFYSEQGCEQLHPSGYARIDVYTDWILNITQS